MKLKHLFIFFIILIASCRVTLVPHYDEGMVAKVKTASLSSDNLYNTMIAGDKTYAGNQGSYAFVQGQITDILTIDSTRAKSKIILIMTNDINNRFQKYTQEHRMAGALNISQLQTYKDYMHAIWESLYNAEKNFK